MGKQHKKYHKALTNAEFSLQFLRDRQGTPKFVVTTNPNEEGKDFCTGIDEIIFAKNLVESKQFSPNELTFLKRFFDLVEKEMEKKEQESWLRRVKIYLNGKVACFNVKGEQMPELQGDWNTKKHKILTEAKQGFVIFSYGEFQGKEIVIPRESARILTFDTYLI